jgi:hypothetical protein
MAEEKRASFSVERLRTKNRLTVETRIGIKPGMQESGPARIGDPSNSGKKRWSAPAIEKLSVGETQSGVAGALSETMGTGGCTANVMNVTFANCT